MRLGDGGFISTGKYLPKWTLPNTQWWISLPFKPEPLQSCCCYQSFSRSWTKKPRWLSTFTFLLTASSSYATSQYNFLRALGRKCSLSTVLPYECNFPQDIFSVDTIVAMEALVRYSYNSRIKDITDLNVEVDIPDSNITMNYYIDGKVKWFFFRIMTVWHFIPVLQGSKKNNNMRISQLRKVIFLQLRYFPSIHDILVCSIMKFQ